MNNFKVLVLSDSAVTGQIKFNLSLLYSTLASECKIDEVSIRKFDKEVCKEYIEKGENLLIFCENKNIDDIIIDNINRLSSDKRMIEDLAVIFEKPNQTIGFFPVDLDWASLLVKAFADKKDKELKYCKFHLFGRSIEDVCAGLEQIKSENPTFNYNVLGEGLLTDIYASYKGEDNLIDNLQVKIAGQFRDYLYSENDLGLSEIVFELLRLKNFKIAIKESVTGGKIISKLFERTDFNQVLKHAEISASIELVPEKVYNDAFEYLKSSGADIVLVAHGVQDEKGLNAIFAIGDKNSIHLYKNRFNAERSKCLEMASEGALFHLIKKLRQNDFAF